MTNYKLKYFNLKGRAEPIRYLFALAGVQYEDVRIELSDWPTYKDKTPHGYMPILEVDGKQLDQSGAIYRYLARELGFAGSSSFEAAQIDMVHDITLDLIPKMREVYKVEDPQKKEEALKNFMEVDVKKSFDNIESILTANNGGDGYLVGDKISFAEISVFSIWQDYLPDTLQRYELNDQPKLKNLMEKVKALPQLLAWIAQRPVTSR